MLSLNLAPIFKERGIEKPYSFLIKAGFSPHTAIRLSGNKASMLSVAHIATLCIILVCEPNDLFQWTPDDKHPLNEDHPLTKLERQETGKNLREIISTMSLKQLQEMAKLMVKKADI